MPAQKRSNDSVYEDEDEDELQRNNQNISEESEEDDVEQEEQAESSDDGSPSSSSSSDKDEFVLVNLADIRKEVQCPICLGIIRKTRKVMECLHRFCRECIDKSMRLGNNECPACRAHCASRRSLRDDPNYDALIALLYPDIDKYEAEELAFHEEEKARNKQIQASIAQTSRRQLEALGKKRASAKATASAFMRRSQGNTRNLRGRKNRKSSEPQGSENEVDADNDNGGKYSSSSDEPSTEVRPKRYKRWSGTQSALPSGANGGCDDNETEGTRKTVGVAIGLGGGSEMLAWGGGGMRSNTRHGGQNSSGLKGLKNSQFTKLTDHLHKLPQNDDKLDIHLKLVSLDKQSLPDLQNSNACCSATMSVTHVCQYVSLENDLQADELEMLLVKENHSELDRSASSSVSPAVTKPSTDELQLLEENQVLSDLITQITGRKDLTIAYRKKSINQYNQEEGHEIASEG